MKLIKDNWFILMAVIGCAAWSGKLESNQTNTEKKVDTHIAQSDKRDEAVNQNISEIKAAVGRIEGYLKAKAEGK